MKRMALAVISFAVGVAGCTGGPGLGPESTEVPEALDSSSSASVVPDEGDSDPFSIQRNATDLFGPLPLEAYMLTTAERYQLNSAIQVLANRCMADFGFPPEESSDSLEELIIVDRESRNRRYGSTDVRQAKVSGLLPAHVAWSQVRNKDKAQSDPARLLVEIGSAEGLPEEDQVDSPGEVDGKAIPPNGCLGDAREKIYGTNTVVAHFVLADDLENVTAAEAAADSRVVSVEKEWVSCMNGRGYSYLGLRDDTEREKVSAGLKEEERPTAAEIQLAVAEAECNGQVGYPAIAYQVEVELQNKAIEDNQLALTAEREDIDKALAKANEVLKEN